MWDYHPKAYLHMQPYFASTKKLFGRQVLSSAAVHVFFVEISRENKTFGTKMFIIKPKIVSNALNTQIFTSKHSKQFSGSFFVCF